MWTVFEGGHLEENDWVSVDKHLDVWQVLMSCLQKHIQLKFNDPQRVWLGPFPQIPASAGYHNGFLLLLHGLPQASGRQTH